MILKAEIFVHIKINQIEVRRTEVRFLKKNSTNILQTIL
jgi:hypothetical protein